MLCPRPGVMLLRYNYAHRATRTETHTPVATGTADVGQSSDEDVREEE